MVRLRARPGVHGPGQDSAGEPLCDRRLPLRPGRLLIPCTLCPCSLFSSVNPPFGLCMSDLSGSSPAAVTKAYDILLWLINHVGKFPRSHRFVLGERIETRMLTVIVEGLIEASHRRFRPRPFWTGLIAVSITPPGQSYLSTF